MKTTLTFSMTIGFIGLLMIGLSAAESASDNDTTGKQPAGNENLTVNVHIKEGESCINTKCHSNLGTKKYVHGAGVNGIFCVRCHTPQKTGQHRFKPISRLTRPLCEKCHSEEFRPPDSLGAAPPNIIKKENDLKYHKPLEDGYCTDCHDAHQSNYFRHLKYEYPAELYTSYTEESYSLCVHCHKDFKEVLTEPRTLSLTSFRNGNLNLHFRHVNKTKGRKCTICHDPHSSKNPRLIKDNFLFGNRLLTINYEQTETGGRCSPTCHRKAIYDRYKPVFNMIKTTPRPGKDASAQELEQSRVHDMKLKMKKDEHQ